MDPHGRSATEPGRDFSGSTQQHPAAPDAPLPRHRRQRARATAFHRRRGHSRRTTAGIGSGAISTCYGVSRSRWSIGRSDGLPLPPPRAPADLSLARSVNRCFRHGCPRRAERRRTGGDGSAVYRCGWPGAGAGLARRPPRPSPASGAAPSPGDRRPVRRAPQRSIESRLAGGSGFRSFGKGGATRGRPDATSR